MTTDKEQMPLHSYSSKPSGLIALLLNTVIMALFACFRMSLCFWSYPLAWVIGLSNYLTRMAKVVLTFFVGGLQGVFRSLGVGVFGEKIHYAILKENGQYLKLPNKSLEDIFTCQLYDYGIRKFLSVSNLEEDMKVTELQFWSTYGMNYLSKNLGLKHVTAVHSLPEKLSKFQARTEKVAYYNIDYSMTDFPKQDVFIFFNRSIQKSLSYDNYVDLIKILTFVKKNLHENGYAVIGNCFTSEGEIKVFEELLDAFGLKVERSEDISRNILHSRKVLSKIHKNRKLAWLAGRTREAVSQYLSQCALLNRVWAWLQRAAGLRQDISQYRIYILENKL